MVHPSALSGKTTHSLIDILTSIKDLVFREYNKDARQGKVSYRDAGMPPFKAAYLGHKTVLLPLPAFSVRCAVVRYEDAPQNAGSDNEIDIEFRIYGQESTYEKQHAEAIMIAECVRQIIVDNPEMPTKEGTEQVFQLGYGEMTLRFEDEVFQNFNSEYIGVEVAVLTARAVFAEMGF